MKTTTQSNTAASDAPAANHQAPSPAVQKVNFGSMAKKADGKTVYPVFPDSTKEASIIAARIIQRSAEFDTLEGQLKTDKAELRTMVSPHYFAANRGRAEIPSSLAVRSDAGDVLVCFQNRYGKLADELPVIPVLGPAFTAAYFVQTFEIKIKGDALPADPEKTQQLINRLQELFAEYNASDALQATSGIAPKTSFHEDRHRVLTVGQNLALEQVCPIIAMIKTKGRGKG